MYDQNICIRCGKQRIVVSTHTEVVNNGIITVKKMVCPDPECQKKVDLMLRTEEKKRLDGIASRQKFSNRSTDIDLGSTKTKS